jgi:hypothetical protein
MFTTAVRLPAVAGVNTTLIVQFADAARFVPQVLLWEKSLLFVPATAMLVMLSAAFPVLVSIMFWVGLLVVIS